MRASLTGAVALLGRAAQVARQTVLPTSHHLATLQLEPIASTSSPTVDTLGFTNISTLGTGLSTKDCLPALPWLVRHYAKAAGSVRGTAAAAPAAAAAAKPSRPRKSQQKLYSCRNYRLRHSYEQVWPTLQLTEEEAQDFRRNSRTFVVDLGRTITLKNKYSLNLQDKVPYQDAKSLLYESNLHLDAVGEHPRYLKIRRLNTHFATKLQNMRKVRLMLGFQRRGMVQKLYETSLVQRGPNRVWKMICAMEAKLSLFATRMGLADDVVGGVRAVQQNRVHLNGTPATMKYARYLEPGDVVSPGQVSARYFQQRIAKSLGPLLDDVHKSFAR